MEIVLIIAVIALAGWWFFLRTPQEVQKVETTPINTKTGDTVETVPSWHTAPPVETKPVTVETVAVAALDVNNDGKVDLADVKEAVKKVRKPRTPKATAPVAKTAVKKAAPKKEAAKKPTARTAKSKKA